MDHSTFSTALFKQLVIDCDLGHIDSAQRFASPAQLDVDSNVDPGHYARVALINSAFKKSEEEVDEDAEMLTFLKFLDANKACEEWKLDETSSPAVSYAIDYARKLLADWFEPQCGTELVVTMGSIESRARFGPGRSVGLKEKPTQYYFKVGDSVQTASSDFIRSWYELSCQNNPLCQAAEMARVARCGRAEVTAVGHMSFVPKSYLSRRIVVTEPSINTYFQLGLGSVMESVLEQRTGINLSTQPTFNQELAKVGSIDGSYSTMDLTQCSDYIALGLVEFMFPKSVNNWIRILRTPSVDTPLGVRELHMASTMGNGFTFPLQTALLTALVLGVYHTLDVAAVRPRLGLNGNFGVFGDDIVVKTEAFNLLARTLSALGLKVNFEKSFRDGSFRESCGADFYKGVNVRGVYIHKYSNDQDYFSIFNRLAIWASKHYVNLDASLELIIRYMDRDKIRFIPPDESLEGGIITPFPLRDSDSLGCWSYEVWVPKIHPFQLKSWELWSSGLVSKSEQKRRSFKRWLSVLENVYGGSINEPAVLKALLYGGIRRERIVTREEITSYYLGRRDTPRWGYSANPLMSEMTESQRVFWMKTLSVVMVDTDLT